MKITAWLKKYWGIPFFAASVAMGAIVGALLQRKWNSPTKRLKTEIAVIDAGAVAAENALKKGHWKALELLEEEHKETIDALEESEKKKIDKLRQDPAAMARWLVRIASDS